MRKGRARGTVYDDLIVVSDCFAAIELAARMRKLVPPKDDGVVCFVIGADLADSDANVGQITDAARAAGRLFDVRDMYAGGRIVKDSDGKHKLTWRGEVDLELANMLIAKGVLGILCGMFQKEEERVPSGKRLLDFTYPHNWGLRSWEKVATVSKGILLDGRAFERYKCKFDCELISRDFDCELEEIGCRVDYSTIGEGFDDVDKICSELEDVSLIWSEENKHRPIEGRLKKASSHWKDASDVCSRRSRK